MELTEALEALIAQEGLSLFGVADTAGFQHALPDWHSRRLVPTAKRALVFGRPFVGPKLVVDDKTNLSNESYWTANEPVLGEIARIRSKIVDLLDSFGFAACNFGGFSSGFVPTFSYWHNMKLEWACTDVSECASTLPSAAITQSASC